jgi:8-oxo-dGTP diphosphatase
MVEKGVAAVVYNPEIEKFLLMKRSEENNYYPGIWQFPGGGLENETPEEGVLRELKEETDLEGRPKDRGDYTWTYRHNDAEMKTYVFLVEVRDTEIEISREHSEYRWVKLDEIDELETFELIHKDLKSVGVL